MSRVFASTLGLTLLTTSLAYGQSAVLPVPLDRQMQSEWCWAASGEMVFNYLGATRITQCDQVNAALGRTDCCGTVACTTDAECTPAGATACTSEAACIPADAPMCTTSADCTGGDICTATPTATAAGRAGQCQSSLCRSGYCTTSSCAGTCTPATCDLPGSTRFDQWDFTTQGTSCSSPLSFAAFQAEIDANRPVEFGWSFGCANPSSGNCGTLCGTPVSGGHAMVAVGYNVDPELGPMVYINDPAPIYVGTQYWLTYADWLQDTSTAAIPGCPAGGTGCQGVHYSQGQSYDIQDDKFCMADTDGFPAASFQHCFDYQWARARSPVTIDFTNSGTVSSSFQYVPGEPVMSEASLASWQGAVTANGSGTANQISGSGTRGSSSIAQCSGLTTTTVGPISLGSGLRPASVSVAVSSNVPAVTSIWTPSEGAFQSSCALTAAQLAATDGTLFAAGYVMADLFAYTIGSTPNFCATWVQKSGKYEVCTGQTLAEYESTFGTLSATMQPVRFAAYDTPSGQLYASLWQPASTGWYEYIDMSPASYQSEYDTLTKDGLQERNIDSLDGEYSVLWSAPRASGCSSTAAAQQEFAPGVFGCAGSVTFSQRGSLCGTNCMACSAGQTVAALANTPSTPAPSYDYWTNEYLNYSGSEGSCAADDNGTGYNCGSETPMRVCVNGSSTDPLGNVCNWYGCGLNSDTQNTTFGGCGGNTTAGTMCCCE